MSDPRIQLKMEVTDIDANGEVVKIKLGQCLDSGTAEHEMMTYTPLRIGATTPFAASQFAIGDCFLIDFTKVE